MVAFAEAVAGPAVWLLEWTVEGRVFVELPWSSHRESIDLLY